MVQCLHGGPKFIAKIIPVSKVSGKFQYEIVKKVVKTIKNSGGKTVSIICDDNKVNQKFFKLIKTIIVGSLRHQKKEKAAFSAASRLSSEIDSPGCVDSNEKKRHALFAAFP